jgi:hypothetical protein
MATSSPLSSCAAGAYIVSVHVGIEVVVIVIISAASVLPVVKSAPAVIAISCIVAMPPVLEFLSQTFSRVVLRVHEVEATLFMSACLLAVGLDSRSHLDYGVGVGWEEFRRSKAQRRKGRRVFFFGDLGESCQSLEADFGGGVDDVGGSVVNPFNAHWLLARTVTSELFDVLCGHFVDPANVHLFVDRFLGEGIKSTIQARGLGLFLASNTCQWPVNTIRGTSAVLTN